MHDRLCNAWFLRATSSHRCRVASLHTAKNMIRRFAASTEQEINKLFEDKDSESLKTYTKTAKEVFHERCKISLIAYSYLLFWKKIDCVSFEKLGTMSYQTSSKRSWQFGTGLVRHCPQGLFSPFFSFLRAIFFRPFRLSLARTNCPWVSEDAFVVTFFDECLSKQSLDDCNMRNYQRIGKYYKFRLIITSSTYHKNLIQ